MPPRIPPSTASIALPTPSVHTHCKSCFNRAFSSTPTSQTRLRAEMFAWLQGPGAVFKRPLPGSTNYLSAYDRRGNLLRQRDQRSGDSSEDSSENATPSESEEDLRPFPRNLHFISQSILSEEVQHEIWHRVQALQKSVRQVSVEMGIDMRRVAAVVRLIEVEKKMQAEVRFSKFFRLLILVARVRSSPQLFMMNKPNRLVFQTSKHGDRNKTNYNSLRKKKRKSVCPSHMLNAARYTRS